MKWAPISARLSFSLAWGLAATAVAQGSSSHLAPLHPALKEDVHPSYEVRIAPSTLAPNTTLLESGPDHWSARGFDLKTLIALVWDVDARRVDLRSDAKSSARYDMLLALPEDVDPEAMQRLLQEALQKKFRLAITPESRSMDVYVLTVPNGPGPGLHRHNPPMRRVSNDGLLKRVSLDESSADESGAGLGPEADDLQHITYLGKECAGVVTINGIVAAAESISEFGRTLEPNLDRLLVDDTNLTGSYDFRIGSYRDQQELFKLMQEQLGLAVVPAQRKVIVLAVRAS